MKYDDPRGATNSKHTDLRSAINCVNSPALMAPAGHYSHMCIAAGQIFISGQLLVQFPGSQTTESCSIDGKFVEKCESKHKSCESSIPCHAIAFFI